METTPPELCPPPPQKKTSNGAQGSKYGFKGKGSLFEVCYGARGISHRAGDLSRSSLEVPLGEAWQEERGERQRSSHGQGREIPSSPSRTSNPQWENMFLSSPRLGPQENLHTYGGSEMHHGPAPSTRRASPRCRAHGPLGSSGQTGSPNRYGESDALRETTPDEIQQEWKLQDEALRKGPTTVLQLPKVRPHGQDMLEGKPDMHILCWRPPLQSVQREREGDPKVFQLWRGSRYH